MYQEPPHLRLRTTLTCPLCDSLAQGTVDRLASNPTNEVSLVVCPKCGKFIYQYDLYDWLSEEVDSPCKRRYKISYVVRNISERARTGEPDNSKFPLYDRSRFEDILQRPDPSVQQKLQTLLEYLGKSTEFPGKVIEFDSANDYVLLCSKNAHEAEFYVTSLGEQGFLKFERPSPSDVLRRFSITAHGWKELERIEQSGASSSNAFIAMSFHPDRNPFGRAIGNAIKSSGYFPVRVDQVEHVNKIDDEIISRIRSSKFLIADLTDQRNGVYFEAGFMLGLGRPVVWICDKGDLNGVHFDTRQYNTIFYEDADDLKTRLQYRIEAIMGKGQHTAE